MRASGNNFVKFVGILFFANNLMEHFSTSTKNQIQMQSVVAAALEMLSKKWESVKRVNISAGDVCKKDQK